MLNYAVTRSAEMWCDICDEEYRFEVMENCENPHCKAMICPRCSIETDRGLLCKDCYDSQDDADDYVPDPDFEDTPFFDDDEFEDVNEEEISDEEEEDLY